MQQEKFEDATSWSNLFSLLMVASIPLLYCYFIFFAFHDNIIHIHRPSDIMIRQILDTHDHFGLNSEHDGIEPYLLFMMILVTGPLGYLLFRSSFSKNVLGVIGMILWFIFLFELHFIQNFFSIQQGIVTGWIITLAVFSGFTAALMWLYNKNSLLGQFVIAELVFVVCFIPLCDISYFDYSYIFGPTLKTIQSGNITSSFFQYDILPSIPAFFILKNNASVYNYRYVVEASMFVFIIAMFLTGRKFFIHKNLALGLLVLAVMMRFFMGLGEVTYCPQVTAIRLDWWLLLFAVSYFWGIADKRLGVCLFILLLLLNALATIYFACYIITLGILFLFEIYTRYQDNAALSIGTVIKDFSRKYGFNMALGFAAMLIYKLITGNFVSESVSFYGAYQIGMLPILQTSSFWYFAAVYVFCFVLLLNFRKRFTARYFNSSIFLLALSAGCSMYFFGRSHENNLINISGSLVFITVLCCDILLTLSKRENESFKGMNRLLSMGPVILILLVFMANNSNALVYNGKTFLHTLTGGPWTYPETQPPPGALTSLQKLTGNSRKVYFMTFNGNDFYLYYRGHYDIPSRFTPVDAWYILSDEIAFANQKLVEGYYVVALSSDNYFRNDFLPKIHYSGYAEENGFIVLSAASAAH